ncbi:uncharacterized protein LOC122010983 [Zingiber officinale]|uniref:uncharacterized protein LOC122010983 n=1 Tax=Zingiber officinale TaxID=94328 RepID=UPI001C4D0021|nr:uncharacterized protein LOC122010983 [Zingiber officinale]
MEESGRIHVTLTAGEYELFKEAKRLAASVRQATISRPRQAPTEASKEPLPVSDRGSKRKQPEVFPQHPYREPGIGYYQPELQAQSLKKEQPQASMAESSQPQDSKKGKALVIPEFTRDSKRATEMGLPPPELAPQLIKMMEEQRVSGQAGPSRPDLAGPSTHQPSWGKEPEGSREVENRGNAAVREIVMISGGPADGDSGRARKSHVQHLEVHVVRCSKEQAASPVISFRPTDLEGLKLPHDDALIIKAVIANSRLVRVFVDTGSSVNILFRTAFEEMQIDAAELQPVATSLYGFTGNEVKPMRQIKLAISLGTKPLVRTRKSAFIVVDSPSSYNVILGRPALYEFRAAVSTFHQKIKFPMGEQVGVVKGEQKVSRRCYIDIVRVEARKNQRMQDGGVHVVQEESLSIAEEPIPWEEV